MKINYKKLAISLLVPGGLAIGAYWLIEWGIKEHQLKKQPLKDCILCKDCITMLHSCGHIRWIDHLQKEHGPTLKESEKMLQRVYNLMKEKKK